MPAFYLVSVHQMAPPPRKDERLSWPSWLISSGRFTHIVVTRQLKVERRSTGSVRRPKTGVPPTVLRNQLVDWQEELFRVHRLSIAVLGRVWFYFREGMIFTFIRSLLCSIYVDAPDTLKKISIFLSTGNVLIRTVLSCYGLIEHNSSITQPHIARFCWNSVSRCSVSLAIKAVNKCRDGRPQMTLHR